MEILFLGTGPAQAIPRPGHRDPACRAARRGGKSRRTRSAAVVTAAETDILIDAGPDIDRQLNRERIRGFDAVLLTHGHADACGGLALLDRWLTVHGSWLTAHGQRIPVFTDALTARRLKKKFPRLRHLTFHRIRPAIPMTFGKITVLPFSVPHSLTPGFPTVGYLFSMRGNKRLAYASDVACLPARARKLLRHVPTLVLDGAMYLSGRMAAHLAADQALDYAANLDIQRLVLTQIGHSYPPHAEAERTLSAHRKNRRARFPKSLLLAYDGLVLRA